MRRIERINIRHDQGDAQEEGSQSRALLWRCRICICVENAHKHTIAFSIRLADQIRDARRCERKLDDDDALLLPHEQRKA